jgi:hypothetical protein
MIKKCRHKIEAKFYPEFQKKMINNFINQKKSLKMKLIQIKKIPGTCILCGQVREVYPDEIQTDGEYICENCRK